MRIRYKPWARPELEASKFYIDNPQDYKGKWKTLFKNKASFHIELGCGKGSFISNLSPKGDKKPFLCQKTTINYLNILLLNKIVFDRI